MAFFPDIEPDAPAPRRRGWFGWLLLAGGLLGSLVVALLPAPYVIERPGPTFDTLSTVAVGGEEVPLISLPGEQTYPTEGELRMLTVTIVGNRETPISWFDVGAAWFDPSRAVLPIDEIYPVGTSVEQSNEQSRVEMENSQQEAIAAALTELDYEFDSTLTIAETFADTPADGVLQAGDEIVSFNGQGFADVSALREEVAEVGVGNPAPIVVLRDGEEQTFELSPADADGTAVIGVSIASEYEFPVDVSIQLENVGGPSAGMMFALGIVDKLSEGPLTGGEEIAGTGTITAGGDVGPIGGIRQKLYGALDAGADWFLAPAANCGEVVGHVPDGLEVFKVETLDDALAVLEVVSEGGDTSELPRCTAG